MQKISFSDLYSKVIESYKMQRRFILYRKPNDHIVYLCIDNSLDKNISSDIHIVIGDFNNKDIFIINPKEIFISSINNNITTILNNNFSIYNNNNSLKTKKFNNYYKLIEKSLILINKNILNKIVLSRKEEIVFNNFDFKNTIKKLIHTNFESFINIWYHPKYGLWLGSTPELLFKINNNKLLSVALAGTMEINNNNNAPLTWNFKELEEHYIVVNYICNILKTYTGKISLDNTKTLYTGLIKHLKTEINFSFIKEPPQYRDILFLLHPTPAICGMPKDIAYNFIINNEEYNRSFYTGYIGIINKNIAEFYVNLRCINILNKIIIIYAGCGITRYSNAKNEVLESEMKIKSILNNIIIN